MDMEFVQFHPTSLKENGVLLSEAARGEGAYLLNRDGERFMFKYAPNKGELASRDVVSRAEWTEILEGRGVDGCVFLDLRHLGREKILERLPQIRELALDATGKDAIDTPIPILPGMHYCDGRHRDRQVTARRACPACTPPASAPASASTAPTAWAATRCSRRSSSGTARAEHAANYIKSVGNVRAVGEDAQSRNTIASRRFSRARAANAIRRSARRSTRR